MLLIFTSYFISIITKKVIVVGKPYFISFEVSSVCNLKCPLCPAGNNEIKRENKFMDLLNFKKIIDITKDHLHTAILYFQGEPFLSKHFIEMIKYCNKNNIYSSTSTNGQLIDEKMAFEIVNAGLDHIIISIDGTNQEEYEKYRVNGSYEKAVNSIKLINAAKKKLNKKTPFVETQMLIFSYNEKNKNIFKKNAKEWGSDKVTLKTALIDSDSDKEVLSPKSNNRYIKKNGVWTLKKRKRNCLKIWQGYVISSDMKFIPCCYDKMGVFGDNLIDPTNNEFIKEKVLNNSIKSKLFKKSIINNNIYICNNCN